MMSDDKSQASWKPRIAAAGSSSQRSYLRGIQRAGTNARHHRITMAYNRTPVKARTKGWLAKILGS